MENNFQWPERSNSHQIVHVKDATIISQVKVDSRTKLQKWICDVFKIITEPKWNYKYAIYTDDDVILNGVYNDTHGDQWLVVKKKTADCYYVHSVKAIRGIEAFRKMMILTHIPFTEG